MCIDAQQLRGHRQDGLRACGEGLMPRLKHSSQRCFKGKITCRSESLLSSKISFSSGRLGETPFAPARRVDIDLADLQEVSTLGYGTFGIAPWPQPMAC